MSAVERGSRVRPFGGRATVLPSPVDEEQLASGLVVPAKFEGDAGVDRGVIVDVDGPEGPMLGYVSEAALEPGTVVYYKRRAGWRIGDLLVLNLDDVLAYEHEAKA